MARKVENSKKQTFRLSAPQAGAVKLVGDFTQWEANPLPMTKGKDGVWTAQVDIPAGNHPYRFIVDGEWSDDPECNLRAPNPFGTEDMIRQVV